MQLDVSLTLDIAATMVRQTEQVKQQQKETAYSISVVKAIFSENV